MRLIFKLFFILLFSKCSSNIKSLLPIKEIKIKSDCKYVVADGIDKISVEVIEETLDKGVGNEKKLRDVTLHVKSLNNYKRAYNSIDDNSIIIEGTEIKFNTPGDYSITASYHGEKTRKPEIVRARKDLKNVHHISKHDDFDLYFRDEDNNEIIPDVKFRDKNGKNLTSKKLRSLFETEDEIILDVFLHDSKLGVLIIYLYDIKLENINNIIIKGEENQLKFNVNIKNEVEIKDYTLVYKKNKEEKFIQITNSNLLDFEKIITNKINSYLESYDIQALVKLKFEKEHEIKTNVSTIFILNKWEEKKNLLIFQPLELKYYRDYYRNIKKHIKVFSKYEDEEEKEIDINQDFIEDRIGFSEIIFKFDSKEIGNIKITYLGNIDINQNNQSIIYKNQDGEMLAYLDRNKLESFSHLIRGFKDNKLDIEDDGRIEWRIYLNKDKCRPLIELSQIKEFNLNILEDYKLTFLYSSPLYKEKLESSPITIILFDKPENQKLNQKLIGGSNILLEGFKDFREYFPYLNIGSKQNLKSRRNFKIEHFKSEDFLIYKLAEKFYLAPLKGFDFKGEVDIKIGNTDFCKIELEVEPTLVNEIKISEWKGLANSITGNYCFANSAFKFLSSFSLADIYYNNGIEQEIENLASYEDSEISKKNLIEEKNIIQYAKAIINGIRLNSKGAFNDPYVGELFIYNFLTQPLLNEGPDPLGDGSQHDATEVIDRLFNILRKKEFKEDTTIMQKKEMRFYRNDKKERILVSENLSNVYSSDESLDPREGKNSEQIIKKYLEKTTFETNSEYFLDLQEKSELILSFKIDENKYTKAIRYKSLYDLRRTIKNLNIFANSEEIEIIENELIKVIDENREEIQFNKRYKIVTSNNIESFLTIEATKSGAVNLYIGKEIILTEKESHIITLGNLLYIRVKRLITENGNNVRLDKNNSINEELKIQTYIKDSKKKYSLKAVIMHSGGANGGHYVVYLKNGNKWSYQSDSKVNHNTSLEDGVYYGLLYEEINKNCS